MRRVGWKERGWRVGRGCVCVYGLAVSCLCVSMSFPFCTWLTMRVAGAS